MSQKENDKGFYIFAMAAMLMAALAIIMATALEGGWPILVLTAITIVGATTLIYFFPRISLR